MPISFAVSDVAPAEAPMKVLDRDAAINALLGGGQRQAPTRHRLIIDEDGEVREAPPDPPPSPRRIEAVSPGSGRPLVAATDANALALAAHEAFYSHYPLALSPDAVWFCLAQGFAHHVNLNAESLRERFVRHEGKKKLVVVRPDFFLGRPNPWPEAFAAFSAQIAAHVGKLRDLVVADFSTTGPVERAASEVVLMDAFQAYFEYEMRAGCGIPSVTLLGTADDWRGVRRRAAMLSEFGLEFWAGALLPVLDEVVNAAEGRVDRGFWRSFFRYQSGSGPSELTGWLLTLFPYIKSFESGVERLVPNPYLGGWQRAWQKADARTGWRFTPEGPGLLAVPGSVASAPVNFVDVRDNSEHPLRFCAGLFGVTQDAASGALAPEFGWAVVHDGAGG
jgi:hypothetical protein